MSADLWCCPNAGSSSALLRGSIAAEGLPRIGRISTERRSRSCASPQSASCSENSAIRPEVSGRTLKEELTRRTAAYVVHILRGVPPGDLPIETPTHFEFVLNLRIAADLGVRLEPATLIRADEVIE